MDQNLPSDEELHAYVDGELDVARAASIARMIAVSAELSELVDHYRADKDLIARIYGPLIEQPVPLALARSVMRQRASNSNYRPARFFAAAAAIAATIIVAIVGYPLVTGVMTDPLVAEAIAVRAGQVHPDRQIPDSEIATGAARDQLAGNTLSVPVKVPNLEKDGYVLTAMTVYPDRGNRHALQLTYRSRDGSLFTMYMRPTAGADRFELLRRGDLQVCVWQDDDLSVVMLGQMPAREMLRVATSTYADLNF